MWATLTLPRRILPRPSLNARSRDSSEGRGDVAAARDDTGVTSGWICAVMSLKFGRDSARPSNNKLMLSLNSTICHGTR